MRARAVLVLCLALATVAGAVNAARAADYPTRPIKLVVPYPAGGPTDVLGRMVADFLTRDLKQTVFVENKGGAQGAIGAEAAARAEPDGYTLFFTVASIVVLNPVLYKKLAYDPDRDFWFALLKNRRLRGEVHQATQLADFALLNFGEGELLAVDAMELAEHVDEMVLFSGDGDFRSLVEAGTLLVHDPLRPMYRQHLGCRGAHARRNL